MYMQCEQSFLTQKFERLVTALQDLDSGLVTPSDLPEASGAEQPSKTTAATQESQSSNVGALQISGYPFHFLSAHRKMMLHGAVLSYQLCGRHPGSV